MKTDHLELGQLITTPQERDAIHIAVAPVIAHETLAAGDHVGFVAGSTEQVAKRGTTPIGVVDPFLTQYVAPGERFWLFLYPYTISSLRHDWTHPAFERSEPVPVATPADPKAESEAWLRKFAAECGVGYDWLMESALEKATRGGYGLNSHHDMPDVAFTKSAEAWRHFAIVTGVAVDPEWLTGDADSSEAMFYCGC